MQNHCMVADPLWRLCKAGVEWKWGVEEQKSFEEVKNAISTKCMGYFNKDWRTEVIVDASKVGLGAVFVQYNPNDPKDRRIISFASRMLSDIERKYSQCELEALAAVWGCEKFWIYLFGKPFTLVTDNRAVQLIFANTRSKPPARIERMALRLSQFDFEIQHRPGVSNMADYYSRHPGKSGATSAFLEELKTERYLNTICRSVLPQALSMRELADAVKADPELQALIKFLEVNSDSKKLPEALSAYRAIFSELNVTQDGILLRGQQLVIPVSLRNRVVQLAHVGHQGIVKTKALIRSRVWFKGIDRLVEERVNKCRECQANVDKRVYEPMRPSIMPAGPWQQVSGDFFGPLSDGTYWLVSHDDYSRWVSVDKVKTCSFECIKEVLDRLFGTIGAPLEYKTDNGPPFNSYRFTEFAKEWGFVHRKITPYWPRANGEAESFMKKLGKVLRTAAISGEDKQTAVQKFLRVYRETPHSTTKVSPNLLLLGFSRSSGIPCLESTTVGEWHDLARKNDRIAKERMTIEYNERMKTKLCRFVVGDRVLLKQDRLNKSMSAWDPDPYTVTYTNGSMITASRTYPYPQVRTRNSSFFKLFRFDELDDETEVARTVEAKTGRPTANETQDSNEQFDAVSRESQKDPLDLIRERGEEHAEHATSEDLAMESGTDDAVGEGPKKAPAKKGRKTKAEAKELEEKRKKAEEERRAANPATRTSERLRKAAAKAI